MIRIIDITIVDNAKDVLAVQLPSYEVEAEIIGFYDIPPLKDTIEALQQCDEVFFGYYEDQRLCGAISLKADDKVVDIHRLIVHPVHFREGIAQQLLDFIINYFDAEMIQVATGARNSPAVHFYKKNGFEPVRELAVNDQLTLAFFEKRL